MTNKCPNCGKDLTRIDLRKTSFCDMVCEKNYRYRMRHMDVITGDIITPDRAKKL